LKYTDSKRRTNADLTKLTSRLKKLQNWDDTGVDQACVTRKKELEETSRGGGEKYHPGFKEKKILNRSHNIS